MLLPSFYQSCQPEQSETEPREIEVLVKEVVPGIFAIVGVLSLLAVLAIEGYLYQCVDMRPRALRNHQHAIGCALFAVSIASSSLPDMRPATQPWSSLQSGLQ
jgi:hypothetical protein